MGYSVLVRRTDFGDGSDQEVSLQVGNRALVVPPGGGSCRILDLK